MYVRPLGAVTQDLTSLSTYLALSDQLLALIARRTSRPPPSPLPPPPLCLLPPARTRTHIKWARSIAHTLSGDGRRCGCGSGTLFLCGGPLCLTARCSGAPRRAAQKLQNVVGVVRGVCVRARIVCETNHAQGMQARVSRATVRMLSCLCFSGKRAQTSDVWARIWQRLPPTVVLRWLQGSARVRMRGGVNLHGAEISHRRCVWVRSAKGWEVISTYLHRRGRRFGSAGHGLGGELLGLVSVEEWISGALPWVGGYARSCDQHSYTHARTRTPASSR